MDVHNPDNATVNEPPLEPMSEPAPEPEYATALDVEPIVSPKGGKAGSHRRFILLIVIVLLVAGAAAYWFVAHKKAPVKQVSATQSKPEPSTHTGSGTATYSAKGQDLNLSFSYPTDWTAVPTSGSDNNDKPISIVSPLASIVGANGQTVTGKVVVSIRPATSNVDELSANNPTEALDSTQFAYTSPTSNQHQYPYLSYVHFSNGQKIAGAFEEVFVTGTQQVLKDYPVESIGTDPIISATIYQCTTEACIGQGQSILSITLSTWQNSDVTKQAQTILASLQLN